MSGVYCEENEQTFHVFFLSVPLSTLFVLRHAMLVVNMHVLQNGIISCDQSVTYCFFGRSPSKEFETTFPLSLMSSCEAFTLRAI